jgi:hypothetical protein
MTHYDTLGISKHASAQEIKTAYRNLAKQYHPDKTQGNKILEEKFKLINHAYDILSDTKKKANYDFIIATYNDNRRYTYPPASPPTQKQSRQRKPYDYSQNKNTNHETYNRKDYNTLEWFALKNSGLASCLFIFIIAFVLIGIVLIVISINNNPTQVEYIQTKPNKPAFDEHIANLNNQLINDSLNYETYLSIGDAYAGGYDESYYYPNRASVYYELAYNKICENYLDKGIIKNLTLEIFHKNLRLEKNKSITLELAILKKIESEYFDPEELQYYQAFIAYHNANYKFCIQYALDYLKYKPSSVRCMMLIIHCQLHLKEYEKAKLNFNEFTKQASRYLEDNEINNFKYVFTQIQSKQKTDCNILFTNYQSPELSVIDGLKYVFCFEKEEEKN